MRRVEVTHGSADVHPIDERVNQERQNQWRPSSGGLLRVVPPGRFGKATNELALGLCIYHLIPGVRPGQPELQTSCRPFPPGGSAALIKVILVLRTAFCPISLLPGSVRKLLQTCGSSHATRHFHPSCWYPMERHRCAIAAVAEDSAPSGPIASFQQLRKRAEVRQPTEGASRKAANPTYPSQAPGPIAETT